ncbi:MAG: MFS transporter [Chloroflexota bacterium]
MDFSDSDQRRKMTLLGGLYITQFLGLGFIITAVPAIMRANGAGLDEIGWIYALGLIWSIKFLWAPLVDRFGSKRYGHYRIWLIVLQSLIIVALVGASFFDINEQMGVLAMFFAMISLFSATQDIAADALAVTVLKPEERGLGNSIQMGGGFLGNMIGGGLVLIAYEYIGWNASLLILAAGTALPLINILMHKEQPAPADARDEKVGFKDMIRYFRRPGVGRWVPILLTYTLGISTAYALINPMLVDLGWSLDQIGIATNIVGSVVSIAGALVIGWVVQKIGRKWAMIVSGLGVGVSIFGLIPAAQGVNNTPLIYGTICLMLLAYGANTTVFATIMMDKSNPETAGTDYTLQYSISSIFAFILSATALTFAESLGYVPVLMIGVGLSLLALILVYFYDGFDPVDYSVTYEMPLGDDAPVTAGD